MSDFIWLLTHNTSLMTKTWSTDGTIENYGDGKYFKGKRIEVSNIRELSEILTKLEGRSRSCVIRGEYVGAEKSREVEPDEHKDGLVLRRKTVHKDTPHRWVMFDIDGFTPDFSSPIDEPEDAIQEFIELNLPDEFHDISYHWQLSSSMGHSSKDNSELRAHVWFWLDEKLTSAQLRSWVKKNDLPVDKSVMDSIQVHFTANPVIKDGSNKENRSGFYEGFIGDSVELTLDEESLNSEESTSKSKSEKLQHAYENDLVAATLFKKNMVKSKRVDGGLNIVCPREDHHTGSSTESSTIYYPKNTGGYSEGVFKCLHSHCNDVRQSTFRVALGVHEDDGVFENIDDEEEREEVVKWSWKCNDKDNADYVLKRFGNDIRYMNGEYHIWNGSKWFPSDNGAFRFALKLGVILNDAYDTAINNNTSEEYLKTLKFWKRDCSMGSRINATTNLVNKMVIDKHDESDKDNSALNKHLFNVNNGVINLMTGELGKPKREYMFTTCNSLDYVKDSKCDLWLDTLSKVYGDDDGSIVSFMQRWFGYCLTGDTSEQVLSIHYGDGANGKSTVLETIAKVMGETAVTGVSSVLTDSGGSQGSNHNSHIAKLAGKRMVTVHESDDGDKLSEGQVKQLTGGETISARQIHKDYFEFKPTHKLTLVTNHLPMIKGTDKGIWRRILVIPYKSSFGTEKEIKSGDAEFLKDEQLMEKLETERVGILAWLVEGAVKWYKEGLNPPQKIIDAVSKYRSDQDRVGRFVDECCTVGVNEFAFKTGEDSIYKTYETWCGQNGIYKVGSEKLFDTLCKKYKVEQKRKSIRKENGGVTSVGILKGISCINHVQVGNQESPFE